MGTTNRSTIPELDFKIEDLLRREEDPDAQLQAERAMNVFFLVQVELAPVLESACVPVECGLMDLSHLPVVEPEGTRSWRAIPVTLEVLRLYSQSMTSGRKGIAVGKDGTFYREMVDKHDNHTFVIDKVPVWQTEVFGDIILGLRSALLQAEQKRGADVASIEKCRKFIENVPQEFFAETAASDGRTKK